MMLGFVSKRRFEKYRKVLETVSAERDAFFQELFEVNRHAAWLTQERQALADRNFQGSWRTQLETAQTELAALREYTTRLEQELSDRETRHAGLKQRLEALEQKLNPFAVSSGMNAPSPGADLPTRNIRRAIVRTDAARGKSHARPAESNEKAAQLGDDHCKGNNEHTKRDSRSKAGPATARQTTRRTTGDPRKPKSKKIDTTKVVTGDKRPSARAPKPRKTGKSTLDLADEANRG